MTYVPRELEEKLERYAHRREIIAIQGPRQVGKTTLLKHIYGETGEPKAFVNMDLPEEREALSSDPITFLRRHLPDERGTLFLDEVQNVENAGQSLKIIYDTFPEVKVFISGSSSLKMRNDVATALVGRLLGFDLLSFNFHEYLLARDRGLAKIHRGVRDATVEAIRHGGGIPRGSYDSAFRRELLEYLRFGGYPTVVLEKDEEIKEKLLSEIIATYLERDVTAYFGVENVQKFMDFLRVLARATGTKISVSSLAEAAQLSQKTAGRFLSILEQSYIAKRIRPYHGNVVTEIRKAPKIYFLDVGIRNAILRNFLPLENRTDAGQLLENFVLREILTNIGEEVWYWRTKTGAEVDFVLRFNEELVPIEVKASGKPSRGFYSFLRAYRPERAFVVTLGEFKDEEKEGTRIYYVPAWFL